MRAHAARTLCTGSWWTTPLSPLPAAWTVTGASAAAPPSMLTARPACSTRGCVGAGEGARCGCCAAPWPTAAARCSSRCSGASAVASVRAACVQRAALPWALAVHPWPFSSMHRVPTAACSSSSPRAPRLLHARAGAAARQRCRRAQPAHRVRPAAPVHRVAVHRVRGGPARWELGSSVYALVRLRVRVRLRACVCARALVGYGEAAGQPTH